MPRSDHHTGWGDAALNVGWSTAVNASHGWDTLQPPHPSPVRGWGDDNNYVFDEANYVHKGDGWDIRPIPRNKWDTMQLEDMSVQGTPHDAS